MTENKMRRDRAAFALSHYWDGQYGGSREELLVDFLTDLRHWAASRRLNWDRAINWAEAHYKAERR